MYSYHACYTTLILYIPNQWKTFVFIILCLSWSDIRWYRGLRKLSVRLLFTSVFWTFNLFCIMANVQISSFRSHSQKKVRIPGASKEVDRSLIRLVFFKLKRFVYISNLLYEVGRWTTICIIICYQDISVGTQSTCLRCRSNYVTSHLALEWLSSVWHQL